MPQQLMPEQLPPQALHDRVVATVRQHWQRPELGVSGYRVPPAEVDRLAGAALDAMLTRPFRVGPLPDEKEYSQLLGRARHWVRRGRPIGITIGYAPMKNPLTCPTPQADWAEFFALGRLAEWHNKVCGVYPPGLKIKIIFDDSTIELANRQDLRTMQPYMRSIGKLVAAMGYQSLVVKTMKQSWFAWLFNLGFYQWAWWRLRRWQRDPANRPMIEKMHESARRNVPAPAGLSADEQERFYRDASYRYRLYCEALYLSRFARFGHALIAMYLDGTQHHVRQSPALHLTSVAKGQVTQPWQGQGCLLDNGKGTLVPTVLTASRRERMIIEEQAGLDVLPLEGFDRIPVCRDQPN